MRDLTLAIPIGFGKRSTKANFSSKTLNVSILVAIVVFGLVYFFEINALGTKGYQIRNLEQQVRSLEESQKNLKMQASNLESINQVQQEAQKLNFVPSTNVTYIKDSDFALK